MTAFDGNRTQFTDDGVSADYLYEAQSNRIDLSTPWDYALDASGNMTHKERPDGSGYRFVFNSQNRLIEARDLQTDAVIAAYAYNALGQRVAKTVSGVTTRFVYGLDGKLLAELSATGAVQREYVWLNGLPLAVLGVPDGATPSPVVFDQIVDNQPATSLAACLYWTKKRDSSAEGGDYLVMGTGANNCNQGYTWTTTLPTQGIYEVYVKWFGSTPTGQTSFRVDGEYLPVENAGKVKGSWVKLKTLAHAPGTISVTKDVYFAPTVHWADAMRVVLVGQDAQDHSRVAYIHGDHLGTPLAMTDKNQRIIWRAEYEPFGQATLNTDPDADGQHITLNLRFPGQYADSETGLHYNYFRDYDPELGRYLQSDPIGLAAGVNTFGYVAGNPLNFVDPLGLRHLTPDEKQDLDPYIPEIDLDNAILYDGKVPAWLRKDMAAVTLGDKIYFRPGVYDPETPEGIAALAHELVHVGQYRNGMNLLKYIWSVKYGYSRDTKYEKPAYILQDRVRAELNAAAAAQGTP